MREFKDELIKRGHLDKTKNINNVNIPFSFEKMASFLSYRSQRHNLFINFLSTKDWKQKVNESMKLFEMKTDLLMDHRQLIRGRSLKDEDLQELMQDQSSPVKTLNFSTAEKPKFNVRNEDFSIEDRFLIVDLNEKNPITRSKKDLLNREKSFGNLNDFCDLDKDSVVDYKKEIEWMNELKESYREEEGFFEEIERIKKRQKEDEEENE